MSAAEIARAAVSDADELITTAIENAWEKGYATGWDDCREAYRDALPDRLTDPGQTRPSDR